MPSDEALRAATEISCWNAWSQSSVNRAAEIIDREFKALRCQLEFQAEKMDDWIGICEQLRAALGPRGRADCAKCGGSGRMAGGDCSCGTGEGCTVHHATAIALWGPECECRKELGLG